MYLGRCDDGCYWFVWKGVLRRVCYAGGHGGTRIETVCRVVDALCDESLLTSLPKTVQQYLRENAHKLATTRGEKHATLTSRLREARQKLQKAIDTFNRVLLLLEVKERARISETLLDESYEAKAILEETITLLEKLEQEE